jgi:DNA-directed RNA polymerase subunit M/transcription elongation factor TFIIS
MISIYLPQMKRGGGSLKRRPTTSGMPIPVQMTTTSIVTKQEVGAGVTIESLLPLLKASGDKYTLPRSDDLKTLPMHVVYEMIYGGSKNGYFSSSRFSKYRDIEREYLDTLIRAPRVVEGITDCPRCGSDRILKVIVTIRSGDEPDANILTCTKCAYRWTVSK